MNDSRHFLPYGRPQNPSSRTSLVRETYSPASHNPALSHFLPPSPRDPCCTITPKIAHFKAFLELAWAHVGPRWLKLAVTTYLSTPSIQGTIIEKIILDCLRTPLTPITLP